MIDIIDLGLKIGGVEILSKISLTLHGGEIVGLLGAGGSGKSALLRSIAGEYRRFDGEILIDARPLLSFSRRELARTITFHAGPPENPEETVGEFLKLARAPFKKMLDPLSDYDLQLVDECLAGFGLEEKLDMPLGTLSGAFLQRAMLAFCFARNTDVLLLDEPTAGLDIRSLVLLQKMLYRHVIGGKKTAIVGSNDLNFIAQTADRIIILEGGTPVMMGGAEIIDTDTVKRFFGIDVFVSKNVYNGKPNVHFFPEN